MRPVGAGAAAVVLFSDINKGKFTKNYQSATSLLVIDVTYLERHDGELVVKDLAGADSHSNSVSSYLVKRPFGWEEVPSFNARMNQAIDHGCNLNDGDVLYSELETLLHREESTGVAIYCFGPQQTQFISGLNDRKVIDITQLGCPPHADINRPGITCRYACHKYRPLCTLRTAYSLAQWLNFHTFSLQYAKCPIPQMMGLIRPKFFFNEEETMYVSIYLNEDLKPQVEIGTSSGHRVLNDMQWFILVTFKSNIAKNDMHELGNPRHTLSMFCGRYIRITSEDTQVYLSKKICQLMELASACIDRQVIKFGRLQDEMAEWRSKCCELKCFYTSRH